MKGELATDQVELFVRVPEGLFDALSGAVGRKELGTEAVVLVSEIVISKCNYYNI